MKRHLIASLGLVAVIAIPSRAADDEKPADTSKDYQPAAWPTDTKQAFEQAKKLNRPLFVFVHADWSSPSKKLKSVLDGQTIAQSLDQRFVKVVVSADDGHASLIKEFKIQKFPTTLVLAPDRTVVERHEGLQTTSELRHELLRSLDQFERWSKEHRQQLATTSSTAEAEKSASAQSDDTTAKDSPTSTQSSAASKPATHTTLYYVKSDLPSVPQNLAVKQWIDSGLVSPEDGSQPVPYAISLTLTDVNDETIDHLSAAVRELAALDLPPMGITISRSGRSPLSRTLTARMSVARKTEPAIVQQVTNTLKKQAITTTGTREPGIALWTIKSDFSSLDTAGAAELKKMLEDVGIARDKIEAAPNITANLLFAPDVALAYEPKAAESLLNWLRSHQLVLEVQSATSANSSWLQVPIASVDADGNRQPFVKKSYCWDWSVRLAPRGSSSSSADRESQQTDSSRLHVTQSLSLQEQWRGDATARDFKNLISSNADFDLKPGKVAIVQAFAAGAGKATGIPEIYRVTSRNSGSLPLLVIDYANWDSLPAFELDKPAAEPKAVAPESATPIHFGNGSTSISPIEYQEVFSALRSKAVAKSEAAPPSKETVAESAPKPSEPLKLIVSEYGGADTDADREQVRKLLEEGILTQQDKNAPPIAGATLVLQPKVSKDNWQVMGMAGGGGGFLGGGPTVNNGQIPKIPPINAAWDASIRRLNWALRNRKTGPSLGNLLTVRFVNDAWYPETDAALTLPEAAPDELAELVLSAFRESRLVVNVVREHPVFNSVPWVKGQETFAVYANETGSPTRILKGTHNELVDIRLAGGSARLFASLPQPAVLLEKQKVQLLTDSRKSSSQPRIVGINVTPEEASLLRAAERRGGIEAIRRDPQDTETRVTPDSMKKFREVLNGSPAQPSKQEVATTSTIPASTTPTFKVFKLHNADAVSQAQLLSQIIRTNGFAAVADARINSIFVTADEESAALAEAILAKTDSETTKPKPVAVARASSSSGTPPASTTPAKPAAELQQTYNDREAAAAKLAKQLRGRSTSQPGGGKSSSDAEEETRLKKELEEAVKKAFEARQAMLKAELDALHARIDETQKSLDTRDKAADDIIDRRVQDLLNPEFKWEEPQAKTTDPFAATATATATSANSFGPPVQFRTVAPVGPSASPYGTSAPTYAPPASPLAAPPQATPAAPTYVPQNPSASRPGSGAASSQKTFLEVWSLDGIKEEQFRQVTDKLGLNVPNQENGKFHVLGTAEQFKQLRGVINELKDQAKRLDTQKQQSIESLTGIWQDPSDSMNNEGARHPDLVIEQDRAAYFSGNEITRRWSIDVESLKPETRVRFVPLDGKGEMEAILESGGGLLKFVTVGPNGLSVTQYTRNFRIVPSEWTARLHEGEKTPPSQVKPVSEPYGGARGGFGGTSSGGGFAWSGSRGARTQPKNPSDYLELFQKTQAAVNEYERTLKTVGMDHADALKAQADREREQKVIAIIQQEFQMELDNAARQVQLKKEAWIQATEANEYLKRQVAKGTAQQGEQEIQRLASDGAKAELESAEARLKLFQSTKDSLFPGSSSPSSTPTAPRFNSAPAYNPPLPTPADPASPVTDTELRNFADVLKRSGETRQPSDYFALLQKLESTLAEYDSALKKVGSDNPLIGKIGRDRDRQLKAVEILRKEFQTEMENAARGVELKSVTLSDANTALKNTKSLMEKGAVSKTELSRYENAVKSAEIELENAQARLKLFESTKDSLFPQSTQEPQPATQPARQKSPEQPPRPTTAPAPVAPPPARPAKGPEPGPVATPVPPTATAPVSPPPASSAPSAPSATPAPLSEPKPPGAPSGPASPTPSPEPNAAEPPGER